MEYQGEDIDDFHTSEIDWGEEEFEPEVEIQEGESWHEKDVHYSWGREVAHEETWGEETDYEISYERGDELGGYQRGSSKQLSLGYTNTPKFITHHRYSPRYSREMSHGYSYKRSMETLNTHKKKSHNYGVATQQATSQSTQAKSTKRVTKGVDYSSNPLVFTGSSKDPEEYLRWETNMKQWLRSHNIPKEKKLDYALSMLDGEAYEWWLKEDAATYDTSKAILDWGTLKGRMYREFTKKYQTTTRSAKSTPNFQPSHEYKSTHCVQPKHKLIGTLTRGSKEDQSIQEERIQQKSITTILEEYFRSKSSNSTNPLELMCYKCKQQGHIAKECPTKKKTKADESLIHTCQESSKHPNLEASREDDVGKEVESKPTCPTLGEELLKQYEPKKREVPKESSHLVSQVSVQTEAIKEVQCLSKLCAPNSVITHLSCQEILNVVSGKGDEDTNDSSHPKEEPPDEQLHGERRPKEELHEPESEQVKEDVKSEQHVKTSEPLESCRVLSTMTELNTPQHDHTESLVNTEVSKLNLDNGFCTNAVSLSIVNRLSLAELPPHTLCQLRRLGIEDDTKIPNLIQVPNDSSKNTAKILNVFPTQTDQFLFSNPWSFNQEVSDLQTQESREKGHGENILHLPSQHILNCLIIKEHMLLTIFQEKLFAVQERNFMITIVNKGCKKSYENAIQAVKEHVPNVSFTKPGPLRAIPKLHELFGATKSEALNYVGNSLSLDILHQLLVYVKGLIRFEKPEGECARISCSEIELVKQWLSVEDNFEFELTRFYDLKNMIMQLFLCPEVECLASQQSKLNSYKFGDELHPRKTQEFTSLLTSARVWDTLE